MKKYTLLFAALGACMVFSCNKGLSSDEPVINDETPQVAMKTVTITAIIDDELDSEIDKSTKTSYSNTGVFSWTEGDEISIMGDNGTPYTFTAKSSGTSTVFTGTLPDGVSLGTRAYFPANSNHTTESYYLPYYKDITGHDSADIPMVGTKGEGDVFSFKHCAGAALLTITNIPDGITSATITIASTNTGNTAQQYKLSGLFYIHTSGSGDASLYPKWDGAYAATSTNENVFSRKVIVTSNAAKVYVTCPAGADNWVPNVLNVTGHSTSGDVALVTNKAMKELGTVERAHIKPLAPLPASRLASINWAGISNYTVSYGGSSMRILDWKGTSDQYYVYLRFRINKAKIAYDDTNSTYDSSNASYIYVAFDTQDGGAAASGGIQGGAIYESQAFVRPFTGKTKGTIEFKDGDDPSSYIKTPVGTATGSKVTTSGYVDGDDAFVSIAIPRSKIGSPLSGNTIHIQAAMDFYYTDTGNLVLE